MIDSILKDKTIFISGCGSLAKSLIKDLIKRSIKKIVIYSRNEKNQDDVEKEFKDLHDDKLRFIIGDIRNIETLKRAMNGCNIVIHTAALKFVNKADYNVDEYIETNINGSRNIVHAAIYNNIESVISLSTDKASSPCTLYGLTKGVADNLFQSANVYSDKHKIKLMVVRYGNVANSNGSIIPYFKKLISEGKKELFLTDYNMTRFWITLDEAIKLIYIALLRGQGGEIFVSKIPSFRIKDLILAFNCKYKITGRRGNEKIHEELISEHESNVWSYDNKYGNYYIIYPAYSWFNENKIDISGKKCENINIRSDNNKFLTIKEIKERIKKI